MAALGTMVRLLILLVVVTLLVFLWTSLSGPKGGSSISEDRAQLQDFDVDDFNALYADAVGHVDTSSEDHLLVTRGKNKGRQPKAGTSGAVKQKKDDHFINNGLLKVYRKIMRAVLNHYQKDRKDFENHPMLRKIEKSLLWRCYNNAITDNTIFQTITERGATAIAKSSEGDKNSQDFDRLFGPLVTASIKYVIKLVGYSMEHDEAGPETEFPEFRHAVTEAATALGENEGAYYDADAYNRWKAGKGKKEIDKIGKEIENAKKAVKAMLNDIVNQLPKFAHVAARVVHPNCIYNGFLKCFTLLCKALCDHILSLYLSRSVSPQTMSALATSTFHSTAVPFTHLSPTPSSAFDV